jgi:Zn finger protein HypA/HybF involved in hydrogenase expression
MNSTIPGEDFLAHIPEIKQNLSEVARRVSRASGLSVAAVDKVLRQLKAGRQTTIRVELADAILTALDRPEAMLALDPFIVTELEEKGWCKHCRIRQPEEPGRRCGDCGRVLTKRGGWHRPDRYRFSRRQINAIHRIHIEYAISLREICRILAPRMGYASVNSCLETLRENLRYYGLSARTQGQATAMSNRARRQRPLGESKNEYKRRRRREYGYRDHRSGEWRFAGKKKP